jgi:hypothetical protein
MLISNLEILAAASKRRGKNKDTTLAEKLRQLEAGEIDDQKVGIVTGRY